MKIAIFSPYSIEKPGGVQDHVSAQAKELMRRGHEVTLLTPRPRKYTGDAPKYTVFTGVSARVKAQSSTVDISGTMDQDEIDSLFSHYQFDVVHFHEPGVPFVARQLMANCPYPIVATLHAAMPDTATGRTLGSIKPYFKNILQHVDVLTRVSIAAGAYLEEILDDVDTMFIPNGFDKSKLKKIKRSKKPMPQTIVFIGRLEKRKGPIHLVRAFDELRHELPNVRLLIAGDGPERSKIEKYIIAHDIPNIEMLGYVSEEDKYKLLSQGTVACFPALYGESFGIVLLEAMASGIPIVAGTNPGYETVLTGRGALGLVDPLDTHHFAMRLNVFLQDILVQKTMREWGVKEVSKYDYTHIVTKYEEAYKKAIAKNT